VLGIAFVLGGVIAWAAHTALLHFALHHLRSRRSTGLRVAPARVDPRKLDAQERQAFLVVLATTWTTVFLVLSLVGLLLLTQQ
jgi:hypothetical protein